jgi:hypothetical protein
MRIRIRKAARSTSEAVVCGPDGVANFDVLNRHGTVHDAILRALDLDGAPPGRLLPVELGLFFR